MIPAGTVIDAKLDVHTGLPADERLRSSARRGDCFDNAVMESFFSTVKSELGERFESHGEAKMELFDYIEMFYDQRRRHSTLGQISPSEFERRAHAACLNYPRNRGKLTR